MYDKKVDEKEKFRLRLECVEIVQKAHLWPSDVLVDIHSGGKHDLLVHARVEGDPAPVLPLIGHLGIDLAMRWEKFPEGLLVSRACGMGCRSFAIEYGQGWHLQESKVQDLADRLFRLLVALQIVSGRFSGGVTPHVVPVGTKVDARENGIFMPLVTPGDAVQEGQLVGRFQALSSGKTTHISAPSNGVVFSLMTAGPAAEDDHLVEVVDDSLLCTRFS